MIASVRPRDLAGKTRRRPAVEPAGEPAAIDKKTRALDRELTELVTARVSTRPRAAPTTTSAGPTACRP